MTPYKIKDLCNVSIIGNEILLDLGSNFSLKCYYVSKDIVKYTLYDNGSRLFDWNDYFGNDGIVLRRMGELVIVFNLSDDLVYSEIGYNLDRLRQQPKSFKNDILIGVFYLETYVYKDDGSQKVYCSGFATNDNLNTYYLGDKGCITSNDLIIKMFEDMFDIIINKNLKKYTFYAHNLSSFDAYFLIGILDSAGYQLKPTVKDNKFISLIIVKSIVVKNKNGKDVKIKISVKLLDSLLLLNKSLRTLAIDFNCKITKGYFPYEFVSAGTLNYIGVTPEIKYFNDISIENYNKINIDNYNLRNESLKYLERDLKSLLEIMFKFNNIIYDSYSLNITEHKTASSLSLNIYCSNYYKNSFNISIQKGFVEREIRKSFFGGLVYLSNSNSEGNTLFKGYLYDINSMYPFCMLKPMPVGDPVLSNDCNLDNYFGFCYAKITPPADLKVPLIP